MRRYHAFSTRQWGALGGQSKSTNARLGAPASALATATLTPP